jgi:hypothetical protein
MRNVNDWIFILGLPALISLIPFKMKWTIRCFVLILMYLSFVLILEKLYLTTKWKLFYLFLMLLCWKKAQKSLISWLKIWHFWCHLKVRFIHFTFKNSVEFTQKNFFKSDNSYTKAHCFYFYVTKRLGSVIKKSVQGESNWSMFWCISVSIQNKRYLGSFGLEIQTYFN